MISTFRLGSAKVGKAFRRFFRISCKDFLEFLRVVIYERLADVLVVLLFGDVPLDEPRFPRNRRDDQGLVASPDEDSEGAIAESIVPS